MVVANGPCAGTLNLDTPRRNSQLLSYHSLIRNTAKLKRRCRLSESWDSPEMITIFNALRRGRRRRICHINVTPSTAKFPNCNANIVTITVGLEVSMSDCVHGERITESEVITYIPRNRGIFLSGNTL